MTETIINAIAHRLGYDIFIDSTRSAESRTDGAAFDCLPAFGRISICDGVEVWGFGLTVVVSPLRVRPQVV